MKDLMFYARRFLNSEEFGGTALVEAEVGEFKPGRHEHISASLSISDCNRTITLDFDVWDTDRVPEVKEKLRRLRETITVFEQAVLAQCAELEKQPKVEEKK